MPSLGGVLFSLGRSSAPLLRIWPRGGDWGALDALGWRFRELRWCMRRLSSTSRIAPRTSSLMWPPGMGRGDLGLPGALWSILAFLASGWKATGATLANFFDGESGGSAAALVDEDRSAEEAPEPSGSRCFLARSSSTRAMASSRALPPLRWLPWLRVEPSARSTLFAWSPFWDEKWDRAESCARDESRRCRISVFRARFVAGQATGLLGRESG